MTERIIESPIIYTTENTNDTYTSHIFRMILGEALDYNPDLLDGLGDVKVVERVEDRPQGEDCHTYLFGDADIAGDIKKLFTQYSLSDNPTPGAYAVYVTNTGYPLHVGRVTEKGTVISKWEERGHVVEHPPLQVPLNYGNNIIYCSEQNNRSLELK